MHNHNKALHKHDNKLLLSHDLGMTPSPGLSSTLWFNMYKKRKGFARAPGARIIDFDRKACLERGGGALLIKAGVH